MRSMVRWAGLSAVLGSVLAGLVISGGGALPAQEPATLKPEEAAALLLNSARRAFNEKQYPVAAERFQQYLATHGNQPDVVAARHGLALTWIEAPQKNYKLAAEQLAQVANAGNYADRPLALYYLGLAHRGQAYEALGLAAARPQEAPTHLQTAQQQFAAAGNWFVQATTALSANLPPPAAEATALSEAWEWAARARLDAAEAWLRQNKFKEALDTAAPFAADPALAKSRYRPQGLYYHGQAAFSLADYLTAGRSLTQLAPFTHPVVGAHARYLLGRAHHLLDERAEALPHYEGVVGAYAAQKAAAQQALQNAAAMQANPEEKLRLETLVKTPPDYVARAGFYWGLLLFEQQRHAEALARFTAFPTENPQSPLVAEAQLRAGMCQVELKQYAEAVKTLPPLLNHPQLGDRANLWLGRALVRGADPAQPQPFLQAMTNGVNYFRAAIDKANQLASAFPEARVRRVEGQLELADALVLAKQPAEAVNVYQQVINENVVPDRLEETLARQAAATHLAGQFDPSDAVVARYAQAYPRGVLLPAVLFRGAENAYARGAAADVGKTTKQSPTRAQWFTEAVKRYQPLVEKYPEFASISLARYRLALAHHQLENYPAAAAALRAIPSAEYNGELASAPYHLADCVFRGLPERADDALAAGKLVQELNEVIKLLDGFASAQPQSPQAPDALLKLASCQHRLATQLASAQEKAAALALSRQNFEKLLQQFPQHALAPQAVLERARVLVDQGDANGAFNEYNRFRAAPLNAANVAPLAYLRLANMLRAQGKFQEAADALAQARGQYDGALANDPTRAEWRPLLHYHQALALKEAGKPAEARAIFEAVLQQFPAWPQVFDAAWRAGECRHEEAKTRLAAARKTLARTDAAPAELAAAQAELPQCAKLFTDAAAYCRDQAAQAAQKFPQSPSRLRLHYQAAWCFRAASELEVETARGALAAEAYKKRVDELSKLTPPIMLPAAPPPANHPLAVFAKLPAIPLKAVPAQPSEAAAKEQYNAVVTQGDVDPLALRARLELAELLAQREDLAGAATLLLDAIDLEPPRDIEERARLRLGVTLMAQGAPQDALPHFEAIAQNPQSPLSPEAKCRAGECWLQAGDAAKAIEQLTPFRDQGPLQNVAGVSDRALLRLGHALALAKQWDASRQAHETLLNRFAQSPWRFDARFGAGWALQNQGQHDAAVNWYAQITRETAAEIAAQAQIQTALCRRDQKRLPEAASALLATPLTYDYPEWSALALLEAARVHDEMQQPELAKRLLERVVKEYPQAAAAGAAREVLSKRP